MCDALRGFQRGFAVNKAGHFFGEDALCFGFGAAGFVCCFNRVDLLYAQEGEVFQEFIHVGIGDFEPELVELVGRGFGGVEPHRAAFGFAEFGAVGFGNQRQRHAVHGFVVEAAGGFRAPCDVAPLVGAANFQLHVVAFV